MSLQQTLHTKNWKLIPRKCKNCSKSIYTIEDGQIYYQCSLFGKFKKECDIKTQQRNLLKPEEILKEV
jgi:hypothetical protein